MRGHRQTRTLLLATFAAGCSSTPRLAVTSAARSEVTDTIAFETTEATRLAFDVSPRNLHAGR